MKENKLRLFLRGLLRDIRDVLRKYPVEMAVATVCFVNSIILNEWPRWDMASLCALSPLVFTLSYIVNRVFAQGRSRVVYYLSWLPLGVPFFFDIDSWTLSAGYLITFLCLLLAVPVFTGRKDNRGFVAENWWFFSGLIISLILCGVAWGLFFVLINCTSELFSLGWSHTRAEEYFAYFAFTGMFALLALSYLDRHRGRVPEKTGVMSVLLDYILTPSIIAFNALFYAYFIKIIFEWSLPHGYVAIMVFIFTLVAFAVKALRELLPRKRYRWYYDNLTYIAIPAVILFWVGTVYRIAEYGLTESRVYLIVCGAIMTFSFALFACKGKGRYGTSWIGAIALLLAVTAFPPINAVNIGLRAQEKRLVRLATELDLLEGPGKLKETVTLKDSLPETIDKFKQLREALEYLHLNHGPLYGVGYYYSYGHEYIYSPGPRIAEPIYCEHGEDIIDMENIAYAVRLNDRYGKGERYIYDTDDKYFYIFWNGEGPELLPYTDDPLPEGYLAPDKEYKLVWIKPVQEVVDTLLANAGLTVEDVKQNNFYTTSEQDRKLTVYEGELFQLIFQRVYIYFEAYGNSLHTYSSVWMFIKK